LLAPLTLILPQITMAIFNAYTNTIRILFIGTNVTAAINNNAKTLAKH
jgi:hypothetical protein